jgi:hypothetical protein
MTRPTRSAEQITPDYVCRKRTTAPPIPPKTKKNMPNEPTDQAWRYRKRGFPQKNEPKTNPNEPNTPHAGADSPRHRPLAILRAATVRERMRSFADRSLAIFRAPTVRQGMPEIGTSHPGQDTALPLTKPPRVATPTSTGLPVDPGRRRASIEGG